MDDDGAYSSSGIALLDAVDLTLDLALATSKLHEHYVRPILFGIKGSNTARGIAFSAVSHYIVDGGRARLLLNENDSLVHACKLNTILGGVEILVTSLRCQEANHGEIGAWSWQLNGLESTAPDKSLEFIDTLNSRYPFQDACTVLSS
jgi:hypothetical protein